MATASEILLLKMHHHITHDDTPVFLDYMKGMLLSRISSDEEQSKIETIPRLMQFLIARGFAEPGSENMLKFYKTLKRSPFHPRRSYMQALERAANGDQGVRQHPPESYQAAAYHPPETVQAAAYHPPSVHVEAYDEEGPLDDHVRDIVLKIPGASQKMFLNAVKMMLEDDGYGAYVLSKIKTIPGLSAFLISELYTIPKSAELGKLYSMLRRFSGIIGEEYLERFVSHLPETTDDPPPPYEEAAMSVAAMEMS